MAPHGRERDRDRGKDKSKYYSKHSSNSSYPPEYPKAWSAWVWSDEHKREYRAREISKGADKYFILWNPVNVSKRPI
jgi:hypothetical protein